MEKFRKKSQKQVAKETAIAISKEIAEKHSYWKIPLTDEQVQSISEATIAIATGEIERARSIMVNAFPTYVAGTKIISLAGYNILNEMIPRRLKPVTVEVKVLRR